jgi:hypothetical protein
MSPKKISSSPGPSDRNLDLNSSFAAAIVAVSRSVPSRRLTISAAWCGGTPDEIPEITIAATAGVVTVMAAMVQSGLAKTNSRPGGWYRPARSR